MSYLDEFYAQVEQIAIVPVVVIDDAAKAVPLARALVAGGLPSAEVTLRTAAALDAIRAMSAEVPEILVGAGTVLNVEQASAAAEAGARYIVSPGYDEALVEWCLEHEMPYIPAGITPTEVTYLVNKGFKVTKFFPASQFGGLATINALASVFVGHRFMPTGGINASNAAEYLANPAIIACGGSWMVPKAMVANNDFDGIEALCAEAAALAKAAR